MSARWIRNLTPFSNSSVVVVVTVMLGLVALSAGMGAVTAQEQPGQPVNFYGDAEFEDGNPVPDGTTIVAVVNGEIEDSINVSDGQYGGPNTFDPKLTTGTGAGDEVSFHIGDASGPEAIESPVQLEAGTFEQNLTFPITLSVGDITTQSNVDGEVAVLEQFDIEVPVENQGSQSQQVPVTIDANGTVLDGTRNIAPGQTEIIASTAVSFGFVGEDQGPAELNINADVENEVRSTSIEVYELGDATHSGAVEVADSTNVLQEIDPFAEPTADTFNPAAADVSRNDEVDVTDSVQILQIIDPFTDPPGYPPESSDSTVSTADSVTDSVQTQQASPDGTFSVTDARGASGDSVTVTVSFTGDGDELAGYAYDLGFDPAVIQPDSDGFIVDTNAPVDQSSAGDDGVFVAGSEGENIGDRFSWTLAFDIVGDPGDQTSINFGGTTQATDENSSEFDLTLESGSVTVEDTEQPAVFDVAITDVPAEVTEGDDITVGYQVENTGDLQGTQDIGFTVDGDQQGTQQVTLTGGETFSNSFTYTTETGDAPTVTVEVASADDSASETVTVQQPGGSAVFDVAITDVPAAVTEGDDITVGYQVENTGDLQGTQDIGFTVDGDQQGTQQVTLTGGETFSNSFTYTTETGDAPTVTVEVAGEDDSASETVTVQQPGGSAVFDVAITDVPAAVTEGDDITVGYQVENTGEAEGSKGISFTVDGDQQGTQQVTLTDDETFSDSFTYTTVSGDTPTVTVEVTSVDDSASETVTVRETQPRELSEEEIDERFDTPEDQRPARAEENTLVGTADGEGSETTFSENIIVESVRINANVDQTVAVAEYDDEVTGIPSPGSVVATADIVVSDSTADTTGTIVERIPVDRLEEVGAEPEDLQVFRVIDGNAEPVGTEVIERTDQVVRLEIETPGFSFFVTSAVSEPEAAFDVTPEQPVAGDELTLSGESSTDEYGEIESYEWQVTGDTIGQRTLTGVEVATVLEQPGEYDVELVIENDAGQTSNETATVTVEQSEPELTGLSVGLGSETLTEGSTTGVTVTAEFDDGSTQDVTADAAIESTNTTVATVSGSTITGDTAGTAEITAEFEGQTASQQLTIEQTEPTLTGVSLELTATTIEVGETTDVTVTAEFDDGTTEDVTGQASIESGDASIASVDETTVTGEDAGDVEITITFNGETATESLSVEAAGDDGSDNNNSTDGSGPGFGIMAAVLAIIILGYAVRRRN